MNIWTIILAAGQASRFGSPKALALWDEQETLLDHAIAAAPDQTKMIVVTGAHHDAIIGTLKTTPYMLNQNWAAGMGSSIACGIKYAADQNADIALILPVDQPFVSKSHLKNLAHKCAESGRCILTQDGDIIGPPAAVPSLFFDQLSNLEKGGLKSALPDYDLYEGTNMLADIDTPDDLERLRAINQIG